MKLGPTPDQIASSSPLSALHCNHLGLVAVSWTWERGSETWHQLLLSLECSSSRYTLGSCLHFLQILAQNKSPSQWCLFCLLSFKWWINSCHPYLTQNFLSLNLLSSYSIDPIIKLYNIFIYLACCQSPPIDSKLLTGCFIDCWVASSYIASAQ